MVQREHRPAYGPQQQIASPLQAVDIAKEPSDHRAGRQHRQRNEVLVIQALHQISAIRAHFAVLSQNAARPALRRPLTRTHARTHPLSLRESHSYTHKNKAIDYEARLFRRATVPAYS